MSLRIISPPFDMVLWLKGTCFVLACCVGSHIEHYYFLLFIRRSSGKNLAEILLAQQTAPVSLNGQSSRLESRSTWISDEDSLAEIICYMLTQKKKPLRNTHPAILQINKELTKACSSLIIDVLAKLTRQARNPGYNLWAKYFIANICLYILCQCVLKWLQMNIKREVSEQAIKGTEQRCTGAAL